MLWLTTNIITGYKWLNWPQFFEWLQNFHWLPNVWLPTSSRSWIFLNLVLTRRVPPLDRKQILSPNLMKLKIWNSYGPAILHTKFERNQRQKNFWHRRVPPLDFSRLRNMNFLINLRGMGSAGPCYHAKIIIVLGLNFDFQVVCKWPSRPQSLAMLTAKVRNVHSVEICS